MERIFDNIYLTTKECGDSKNLLMGAKKIVLIATGKNKAKAIRDLLKGPKTEDVPCSILQDHPDCPIYVDEDAYSLVK